MIITDPPYNVAVNGHVGGRGKIKHAEFTHASGEMTTKQFRKFLKTAIVLQVKACDDDALLYIFIDWRHVEDLTAVGRKLGLELRNICVW
ncbi:MAG: DNA methylase N-4, partial [Pseudomonadota bacterium]